MIFCHMKWAKEASEFLQNDICLHTDLLFGFLSIILHSQKCKFTVVPGTQTTPQIVFGALFEFYTTCDFQISQTWSKY